MIYAGIWRDFLLPRAPIPGAIELRSLLRATVGVTVAALVLITIAGLVAGLIRSDGERPAGSQNRPGSCQLPNEFVSILASRYEPWPQT